MIWFYVVVILICVWEWYWMVIDCNEACLLSRSQGTVCRTKKSSNWPIVEYIFILLWNTGALKMYNGSEWSHCTQWKDILVQMVRMCCEDWRVRCTNSSVKLSCAPLTFHSITDDFCLDNLFRTPLSRMV